MLPGADTSDRRGRLHAGRSITRRGIFRRRDIAADRADGWPSPAADDGIARVVFTVLPGRSFGRYRHRAWPLWIADAAYAVAGVLFLLGVQAGPVEACPRPGSGLCSGCLARRMPMPGSVAGSRREIPLAAIEIPHDPVPIPRSSCSRSPALARDRGVRCPDRRHARSRDRAHRESFRAASRGATEVRSRSVPITAPSTVVDAALWSAHLDAARLCYEAALLGDRGTRPVSGLLCDR